MPGGSLVFLWVTEKQGQALGTDHGDISAFLHRSSIQTPGQDLELNRKEFLEQLEIEKKKEPPTPPPSTESLLINSEDLDTPLSMDDLSQSLLFDPLPKEPRSPSPADFTEASPAPHSHSGPSSNGDLFAYVPTLMSLSHLIVDELWSQRQNLLKLNPSRRELLVQYLNQLDYELGSEPGKHLTLKDLHSWIEPEGASDTPRNALKIFFEEISIVSIAQALVLKGWSDRGIRKFKEPDLNHLNWVISRALHPLVPMDRDGWQLTRRNLYSWYNPSPPLQKKIWNEFSQWNFSDYAQSYFAQIIELLRKSLPQWKDSASPEKVGYDSRFQTLIWDSIHSILPSRQATPASQTMVFTPTLRDGKLLRSAPASFRWVGLEDSLFQLILAELVQMSWEPIAPPQWIEASGTEVLPNEQAMMNFSEQSTGLVQRIRQMEAFDLSVVLEESRLEIQSPHPKAQRIKKTFEPHPVFQKFKSEKTSLGAIQACVALSKLRPGGHLLWARETPLGPDDGPTAIELLLGKATLACEWDFSHVHHSLPTESPLYPKHVYLFRREIDVNTRRSHHPKIIKLRGQIRSHIEVPHFLTEAFQSHFHPEQVSSRQSSRGKWKAVAHESPLCQQEWMENWPTPACEKTLKIIETLREDSTPLGQLATIRPIPADAKNVAVQLKGFCVSADKTNDFSLRVTPFDQGMDAISQPAHSPFPKKGFFVFLPDQKWAAPLAAYLESALTSQWLKYSESEKKGKRWSVSEQSLKLLPVPHRIRETFDLPNETDLLDAQTQSIVDILSHEPENALERLRATQGPLSYSLLYAYAARAWFKRRQSQSKLCSMVQPNQKIKWRELMNILPPQQKTHLTQEGASFVGVSGSLPSQIPISHISKVKAPTEGILLASDTGLHLHLSISLPKIKEIVWEQIQELLKSQAHPTWEEVKSFVVLPRNLEMTQTTADEICESYRAHVRGEQADQEILSTCLKGEHLLD